MNLYIRYFDEETLVYSVDEALDFLASLGDINVDENLATDLNKFFNGSAMYPKHFKVHARSFFIAIKTTAATMEEFKAKGAGQDRNPEKHAEKAALAEYGKFQPGWYRVKVVFKRVVSLPDVQKFQYVDTVFEAKLKATSVQDSYDRVLAHLRSREDVDPRCQFPSIKNVNFEYTFLGTTA